MQEVKGNMLTVVNNAEIINQYLAKEVKLGQVVGPLDRERHPRIQISKFGVILKNRQKGKCPCMYPVQLGAA